MKDWGTASLREIRSGIWRGTLAACALALLGSLLLLHGLLHRPMRAVHRARDFAAELARADGRQLADDVGAREVRELGAGRAAARRAARSRPRSR